MQNTAVYAPITFEEIVMVMIIAVIKGFLSNLWLSFEVSAVKISTIRKMQLIAVDVDYTEVRNSLMSNTS